MHAIRTEFASTLWEITAYHGGSKMKCDIINHFAKNINHFLFLSELGNDK
jgi:hypothetical protein